LSFRQQKSRTMHRNATLEPIEAPLIPSAGRIATGRSEPAGIVSLNVLRGLVMALMALDHTRDFLGASGFNSTRCDGAGAIPHPAGLRIFAPPPSFFLPDFRLFSTAV
jgi:hypothetical protein